MERVYTNEFQIGVRLQRTDLISDLELAWNRRCIHLSDWDTYYCAIYFSTANDTFSNDKDEGPATAEAKPARRCV